MVYNVTPRVSQVYNIKSRFFTEQIFFLAGIQVFISNRKQYKFSLFCYSRTDSLLYVFIIRTMMAVALRSSSIPGSKYQNIKCNGSVL